MAAESFVKKNRVSDDDKVAADDAATFAEKREKGLPPFFLRRADRDGQRGKEGRKQHYTPNSTRVRVRRAMPDPEPELRGSSGIGGDTPGGKKGRRASKQALSRWPPRPTGRQQAGRSLHSHREEKAVPIRQGCMKGGRPPAAPLSLQFWRKGQQRQRGQRGSTIMRN